LWRGDRDASELEERGMGEELPSLGVLGDAGVLLLLAFARRVPGALDGRGEIREESEVRFDVADALLMAGVLLWRARREEGEGGSDEMYSLGDVRDESEAWNEATDEPDARGETADELEAWGEVDLEA
jgi:hypothetical protein